MKKVQLNVRIDAEMREDIKRRAKLARRSVNTYVEILLANALARESSQAAQVWQRPDE